MGVIQDGYYYPKPDEITLDHIANCDLGEYSDRAKEMRDALADGYFKMAVSLLSREDIESLGWKSDYIGYVLGGWQLLQGGPFISIKSLASGSYNGPCPTINELRYLMNLLKIENGKTT